MYSKMCHSFRSTIAEALRVFTYETCILSKMPFPSKPAYENTRKSTAVGPSKGQGVKYWSTWECFVNTKKSSPTMIRTHV